MPLLAKYTALKFENWYSCSKSNTLYGYTHLLLVNGHIVYY